MSLNVEGARRYYLTAAERRAHRPASIDRFQDYSIAEACAARDESHVSLRKTLRAHEAKLIKRGTRTVIPGSELIRIAEAERAAVGISN